MNDMVCSFCGENDWTYLGEHFDDEHHLGSFYECNICGHQQDDNPDDVYYRFDEMFKDEDDGQ